MSANNAGVIVRTLLTADAAVAALVGARIYPEEAPEETDLPLIVYGVRLQEAVDGSAPISAAAVDVHCYGATDDASQALAVAVDGALASQGGVSGGTIVSSLVLEDWDEAYDSELAVWGRLMRYGAVVIRG